MMAEGKRFVTRRVVTGIVPLDGQSPEAPEAAMPPAAAAAIDALAPPGALYAILEAARVVGLPEILETSGLDWRPLFKGDAADRLEGVAPYLVALPADHGLTRAFFAEDGVVQPLWGQNAGVLLVSHAGTEALCAHLRRLTMLRDAAGRWSYFRFYAPATLHGLVPHLAETEESVQALFGDVIAHLIYQVPARDQLACLSPATTPPPGGRRSVLLTPEIARAAARATDLTQVETLRRDAEAEIAQHDPDTHAKLIAQPRSTQFRNAKLLWRMGVRDARQAARLLAIVYGTGLNILSEPAFFYATRNPFLSANARARQLISAYRMIARMKER